MLLQNNGNLVVYNKCGNRLWESRTRGKCDNISGIYISFSYIYAFFTQLVAILAVSFFFCDNFNTFL